MNMEIEDAECPHCHRIECMCKVECEKCLNKFERVDTLLFERKLYCLDCGMKAQFHFYKNAYDNAKNDKNIAKAESNLFRSLMLKPETMEALANDPSMPPARIYIQQHKIDWAKMSLDSILYWLGIFEAHVNCFAELANEKATKQEISDALLRKTAKAMKDGQEPLKKKEYLTDEEKAEAKAIAGFIKMGMKEADAKLMVKQMTGKLSIPKD